MKRRILAFGLTVLATGLWSGVSIQAATKYHLIVVHASDNTEQGVITVDRATLHPVPLVGTGQTDCSSAVCGATYPAGTRVTLTATAAPGSTFMGWSGECSGTSPFCVVRLDRSRDVRAHFGR